LVNRDLKIEPANEQSEVEAKSRINVIKQQSGGNFLTDKIEIIKYTIKLIQEDGFLSLYDGMTSSIFGSMVQYAIYFCASKFWSYTLDHMNSKLGGLGKTMLINLVAATCTAIVTNPIWVVNARMARKSKQVYKYIFNFFVDNRSIK
jgi:hypothetical protein